MADRRIKAIIEAQDRATPKINKLRGAFIALGTVISAAVIGRGIRALTRGIGEAVDAAAIQEQAEVTLAQAIRQTGESYREVLPELKAYASQLQDLTGVGDEAILKSQALLVSIGQLEGEGLKRATRAALDLSAAIGVDQRTAFDLVAKAAAGYTGTLSRYGIIIDQSLPQSEKFAAALELIEQKFGGQAQAQLNTFTGRLKEFQGRVGDLQEAIGGPFKDIFTEVLAEILSPFVKKLTEVATESNALRTALVNISLTMVDVAEAMERIARSDAFVGLMAAAVTELARLKQNLELVSALFNEQGGEVDDISKRYDALRERLRGLFDPKEIDVGSQLVKGVVEPLKELSEVVADLPEFPLLLGDITGPVQDLETMVDLLGLVDFSELEVEARRVSIAMVELERSGLAFTNPKRYRVLDNELREIATTLEEMGVFVAGFTSTIERSFLSADEALQLFVEGGDAAIQETGQEIERLGITIERNIRGIAVDAANEFGDALVDAAFEGEIAFDKFFKSLIKDILKAIVKAQILDKIIKNLGQSGGGGSQGSSAGSSGSDPFFPTSDGGTGSGDDPFFPTSGARYGGIVGTDIVAMQSGGILRGGIPNRDSIPVLAQSGESFLSKELTDFLLESASGGGGGMNVTINAVDGESVRRLLEDNPEAVAAGMQRAARAGL